MVKDKGWLIILELFAESHVIVLIKNCISDQYSYRLTKLHAAKNNNFLKFEVDNIHAVWKEILPKHFIVINNLYRTQNQAIAAWITWGAPSRNTTPNFDEERSTGYRNLQL